MYQSIYRKNLKIGGRIKADVFVEIIWMEKSLKRPQESQFNAQLRKASLPNKEA